MFGLQHLTRKQLLSLFWLFFYLKNTKPCFSPKHVWKDPLTNIWRHGQQYKNRHALIPVYLANFYGQILLVDHCALQTCWSTGSKAANPPAITWAYLCRHCVFTVPLLLPIRNCTHSWLVLQFARKDFILRESADGQRAQSNVQSMFRVWSTKEVIWHFFVTFW